MPDKKNEKKKMIEKVDASINYLSARITELNLKLDQETDPEVIDEIKKSIQTATQQMNYEKSFKQEYEDQLKKIKEEEKRKEIDNIVKMAVFTGIMIENQRNTIIAERIMEQSKDEVMMDQFEHAKKKVFAENNFRFVTEDMAMDILANEEFHEMAEVDPERLNREEDAVKEEYNRVIQRTLSFYGMEVTGDFEKDEAAFSKAMEKKNSYELVAEGFKNDILPMVKKLNDPQEEKAFNEMYAQFMSLGKDIRDIQKQFVDGDSSFKDGNGFTREMVAKEQAISDLFNNYIGQTYLEKINEMAQKEPERAENYVHIYARALQFVDPIAVQLNRDKLMAKNNALREKMEMWQVYEKLPKGAAPTVKKMKEAVNDEYRAWEKLERMARRGAEVGGIYNDTTTWAVERAQDVFGRCKEKPPIEKVERKTVKYNLAAMVLSQMINDEASAPLNSDKRHYNAVTKRVPGKNRKQLFEAELKTFAESPEFTKLYDKVMKGKGDFKQKCIKFIANDLEKKMAKQLKQTEIEASAKEKAKEPKKKDPKDKKGPAPMGPEAPMVLTPNNWN